MKKLLITWLSIILVSMGYSTVQARANEVVYLSNTDIVSLDLNQSSLEVSVSYPGPSISGICGVEIRADSYGRFEPISNLLNAITIKEYSGITPGITIKNNMTILIDAYNGQNAYASWFKIETKDGSSLKHTILSTLGESRKVVLVAVGCN